MPLLVTEALVLHMSDYLESSRILRVATREAGVQSVVARGARNSRKRFGSAVDLFAVGQAQIEMRPGRDLHTLVAFEVARSQPELASDLARFSAAAALAECALRVMHEEAAPIVYDGLIAAYATLIRCSGHETVSTTIGALWRLVRDAGFAPSLQFCAECHNPVASDLDAHFSHVAGGVLCADCASRALAQRRLPATARQAIVNWMDENDTELSHKQAQSHQRLLREFIAQHVTSGRPLKAFASWEANGLS